MNISDYVKPAMAAMMAKHDGEIKDALDDFCPGWALVDIKRRCHLIRIGSSPVETLYMDGMPILEIHPPQFGAPVMEDGRNVVRITQNFRRLSQRRGCSE